MTEGDMMQSEAYAQIIDDPASDDLRARLADWLEPRWKPRSDFVRAQLRKNQLRRARTGEDLPKEASICFRRSRSLLEEHRESWERPVRALDYVEDCMFIRGCVEDVTLTARGFLDHVEELYGKFPIRHLQFSRKDTAALVAEIAASPHLQRLVSLRFRLCRIGDEGVRHLAESPHLRQLRYLSLGFNDLTQDGLEALCASQNLPNLEVVGLVGNRFEDPVEGFGVDTLSNKIVREGVYLPPIGREMVAKYGEKRWLRGPSLLPYYPPLPEDFD